MWSGTQAELDVTPEWKICDGNNGTPDLRNKFIVASNDISKTGITTQIGVSPYEPGDTGGSANATLVTHNHGGSTGLDGSHSHTPFDASHTFGVATGTTTGDILLETNASGQGSLAATTSTVGNHAHTISNDGSAATNANLPPYYALAYIMRTS